MEIRGVDITIGRNRGYGYTATGVFTVENLMTIMYLMDCQELDDASCLDGYRTACLKCLRMLSKARNIVPSSFVSRDVTRVGKNPIGGGGFAVSIRSSSVNESVYTYGLPGRIFGKGTFTILKYA